MPILYFGQLSIKQRRQQCDLFEFAEAKVSGCSSSK